MNKIHVNIFEFILITVLFSLFPVDASTEPAVDDTADSSNIIEKYGRNVCTVHAYKKKQISDNITEKDSVQYDVWSQNIGTAFLIDNEGHLITLNSVIKNAEEVKVILYNGEKIKASVLGRDKTGNIIILKTDFSFTSSIPKTSPCKDITTGKEVTFLTRHDTSLTVISGIISHQRPPDGTFIVNIQGNPGTSGTPVFDANGLLLGFLAYQIERINSPDNTKPESDSYVIFPAEYVWLIARSVINQKEKTCGWLGIYSSVSNDRTSGQDGVVVHEVIKDSPAEKCGLKVNDNIVELNRIPISSPSQLIETMSATQAGDNISIKYLRSGKIYSSNLTLSKYPE